MLLSFQLALSGAGDGCGIVVQTLNLVRASLEPLLYHLHLWDFMVVLCDCCGSSERPGERSRGCGPEYKNSYPCSSLSRRGIARVCHLLDIVLFGLFLVPVRPSL